MSLRTAAVALLSLSRVALGQTPSQSCLAYGVDFQDGGSYFQNVSSTAPFTFVSQFSGCQNDTAQNLLVDPEGNEIQCTDTPLRPDFTDELSTCPINKNKLTSGDWSILVISNNGVKGSPIAYERDFVLTVGTPVTVYSTPTVTATVTSYSCAKTTTVTETDTDVVSKTVTVKPTGNVQTKTYQPWTGITVTSAAVTYTQTTRTVVPVYKTSTITATCQIPQRQQYPDPHCRFTPSIVYAAAMQTDAPRRYLLREVSSDRAQRVAERRQRLASIRGGSHQKRAPDAATVTSPATDTAKFPTVTVTVTSKNPNATTTVFTTSTATITEICTDVASSGPAKIVTWTAPLKTRTRTQLVPRTVATTTITLRPTVWATKTAKPTNDAHCRRHGGKWW